MRNRGVHAVVYPYGQGAQKVHQPLGDVSIHCALSHTAL
ncbi:hypothetical protein GGR23_003564 [Gellertiella hungarica]|uniref:Uncharacterized protein n=1 Tax=Gellertiella hungarica TaxID=1572859 RepID=A0A7W6J7Q8_9HYPH|nr:hypothetical protein [Gellertiella hungarica]